MRNDRSTIAIAMPSVLRVIVPASCEIGSARLKAKTTSAIPASRVVGMLISVSTSPDVEPDDQPVEEPRQQERLQRERERG